MAETQPKQNLENKINEMDLSELALQVSAKSDPGHIDLAIENYISSRSEVEKKEYKWAFDNLTSAYEQAVFNSRKTGDFHLNEYLSNYFRSMEQGYVLKLNDSKLEDINEALEKLGYKGEKLISNENLTVKEILDKIETGGELDKEKLEKASDAEKLTYEKTKYASHALIKLAKAKLEADLINKKFNAYNEMSKPKEEKSSE